MSCKFVHRTSATLIFVVCLLAPNVVLAHAVVIESSLEGQTLEPLKATQILLNFNSAVELALSKIFLVRKGDKHEPVSVKLGSKSGQVIVSIPALKPGNYAIRYKIFAADGHLTEDIIRFSVAAHSVE